MNERPYELGRSVLVSWNEINDMCQKWAKVLFGASVNAWVVEDNGNLLIEILDCTQEDFGTIESLVQIYDLSGMMDLDDFAADPRYIQLSSEMSKQIIIKEFPSNDGCHLSFSPRSMSRTDYGVIFFENDLDACGFLP